MPRSLAPCGLCPAFSLTGSDHQVNALASSGHREPSTAAVPLSVPAAKHLVGFTAQQLDLPPPAQQQLCAKTRRHSSTALLASRRMPLEVAAYAVMLAQAAFDGAPADAEQPGCRETAHVQQLALAAWRVYTAADKVRAVRCRWQLGFCCLSTDLQWQGQLRCSPDILCALQPGNILCIVCQRTCEQLPACQPGGEPCRVPVRRSPPKPTALRAPP